MAVSKSIDCAGTNLDIYDEPVGINLSGGADSAILLYHLMKHSKDTIHIFSIGINEKLRVTIPVAKQVIEACIRLTGNTNVDHHISISDNLDGLWDMPTEFIEEKRVKVVYSGVTSIPPKKVIDTFKLESQELVNRDPNVERDVLRFGNAIYSPWTNIDKKAIASMYKKENLIETLFSITRSCEYEPLATHNIYENIKDPGTGHCGICWWCEERYWAFGRLQ